MNDLHVTIEINYMHSFTEDLDQTKEMYAGRGVETKTPHKETYKIDLRVSPEEFCLMWQDLIKRVRCFTNVQIKVNLLSLTVVSINFELE